MQTSRSISWNQDSPWRYLIYLALLIPVFIFRDYTPSNELKYISIVEEALRDGTWFTFHNHGEAYADKPPLFFWLMMLSRLVTGGYHMWIIGLFTLVPAVGILAVMDRWMRTSNLGHNPLVSNLLLLTTVMYIGSALVVRMDMMMVFFIVLSLYTFFRVYEGTASRAQKWFVPVWIFLAIFSKGPMGFLVPVISIYAFLGVKRDIRYAGRWFGWRQWLVLIALCGAWFLCIWLEGGSEYLNNILFKQTVGRGIDSFHHKEPVWFYFPRMLWSFAFWTVLYIVLLWQGIRRRMFTTDTQKFFAVIIVSSIILLSLVSSKIDIYLLPIYPFVVYLCASVMLANRDTVGVKIGVGVAAAVFALMLPGYIVAGKHLPFEITGALPYIGTGIMTAGGIAGIVMICRRKAVEAVIPVAGSLLIFMAVGAFVVPQVNRHIGFREMAGAAKTEAADNYAYYRYSSFRDMDVFLGRQLERVETVGQLDSLGALPGKTVVFIRTKDIRRNEELKEWAAVRQPHWTANDYGWYIVGITN